MAGVCARSCSAVSGTGRRIRRLRDNPGRALCARGEGQAVVVLGNGGREHALAWKLRQSPGVGRVIMAPPSLAVATEDLDMLPLTSLEDPREVVRMVEKEGASLVVVGPEVPLVCGVSDALRARGISVVGPSAKAAQLEGSKRFMKEVCDAKNIPTAAYRSFTDAEEAKEWVRARGEPMVVKANGLAAGKGVVVPSTVEESCTAIDDILLDAQFGEAGEEVVVEELLRGEEVSFFALVDIRGNVMPLASAQDHKRVGEGDTGLNTGGMGAYSPAPILSPELEERVMREIIHPTVKGMTERGCSFSGVLYAGLMIDNGNPKLLEYNVRFGDPECQVLMSRLDSDLLDLLQACADGDLNSLPALKWSNDSAMVVVMAAKGYPGSYEKGTVIEGLETVSEKEAVVFHAGTSVNDDGNVVATGGRVLGVTARGPSLAIAKERAYNAIDKINWEGGFCRRDIGWRAL